MTKICKLLPEFFKISDKSSLRVEKGLAAPMTERRVGGGWRAEGDARRAEQRATKNLQTALRSYVAVAQIWPIIPADKLPGELGCPLSTCICLW